MKQKVDCTFEFEIWIGYGWVYTCKVRNKTILENAELEFVGKHLLGKSNTDILALSFNDCDIAKIPQASKVFPNLRILQISMSKLKYVEREDLKEYDKVTHLYLYCNEIEFIPGDLFADKKNLEGVGLAGNMINVIEPNLLDGMNKLKLINFCDNPCISLWLNLYHSIPYGNANLEGIKQEIRQKYFAENMDKLTMKDDDGISDDLKRIMQNEKLKDFTIVVDSTEFKVHKLVLAARSRVFSDLIENNIDAVSLNIDSISTKNFREVLNFIYTDKLPKSNNIDFPNLFMAADKLKIDKLKEFCAEKLIEKLSCENAYDILLLANKYDHESLRQKSFDEIKKTLGFDKIDAEFAKETYRLKLALDYKKKSDAKLRAILKKN